jgi:hypothetical protein
MAATAVAWAGAPGRAADKSAAFKVTTVEASPNGELTMTSQVWITSTRARADIKHPLQGNLTILFRDGLIYQLDPKAKKGVKGPAPDDFRQGGDLFPKLLAQMAINADEVLKTAQKQGAEPMAGFNCDVFTNSKSSDGMTKSVKLWVPQQADPKFPLKAVLTTSVVKPGFKSTQSTTITLSEVKLNQPIADSVFAVPAGYKIATGKPQAPGKSTGTGRRKGR